MQDTKIIKMKKDDDDREHRKKKKVFGERRGHFQAKLFPLCKPGKKKGENRTYFDSKKLKLISRWMGW